jgi:hypothetical protein
MALGYTWRQLVQRIWRHVNSNFPNQDFNLSENETLLYINDAMSYGLVGMVWNGAKVTGSMEVPDGYLLTFKLPALTLDNVTQQWSTTLPQPPLSLPLGYSVSNGYFANSVDGMGEYWIWIKAKRVSRRKDMPMQFGVRASIEGGKIFLTASNGASLRDKQGYVTMPSVRAGKATDVMNIPDDATDMIFTKVVNRIKERLGLPQDIIKDGIEQGIKTS